MYAGTEGYEEFGLQGRFAELAQRWWNPEAW